ncbi:MAG: YgaP family membrane protein [Pseudomonadota bacterium]
MTRNVGTIDRVVRLVIAAAAIWLFFAGVRPAWEYVALVVGVVLGVTAVTGICPAYRMLKLDTTGKSKAA